MSRQTIGTYLRIYLIKLRKTEFMLKWDIIARTFIRFMQMQVIESSVEPQHLGFSFTIGGRINVSVTVIFF